MHASSDELYAISEWGNIRRTSPPSRKDRFYESRIQRFALVVAASPAFAEWTPPGNPDPQKILQEAQADAAARRYEDALAKHVWYHQNALKIQPAQYGVRLSFALSDWAKLGAAYPPALKKLESIRDEDTATIRDGKGSRELFHDISSINATLKEEVKTKDLFVWLDSKKPDLAKQAYNVAQPALIKAKEYRVCGRYIDPDKSYEQILLIYQSTKKFAENPKFGKQQREIADKGFSNGTATLVALLVINERKADAERIATKAAKEWNDPGFKTELKAAQGQGGPRFALALSDSANKH